MNLMREERVRDEHLHCLGFDVAAWKSCLIEEEEEIIFNSSSLLVM